MEEFLSATTYRDANYSDLLTGMLNTISTIQDLKIKTKVDQIYEIIQKVEFYPPTTKITFTDGEVITATARHGDEFNEEIGIMHCLLKRYFKGSGYNTFIRRLIKDTHRREAEEFLAKEEERKAKEAEIKAQEKAREKKQKRLAREREEQIEIQKEAYIRAMKELEAAKNGMKGKK